ncbi:MAG: ABC transporter substrate-binding protein [Gaiellaceae bacterium]
MGLTTVTRTQGANRALKDGSVRPEGVELELVEVDPLIKAFRQMVRGREYDVCELAITTYLCAKEHGARFTALPVFLVRSFHHGAIAATKHGDPKTLEGSRVGVNRGYTVTTGVWARAVLAAEYGVDLDSITWVLSGDEHVAEYVRPANVVSAEGRDLAEMLRAGELAAAIGVEGFPPLLADAEEAGYRSLRERGLYPINHLVVMRDELLDHAPAVYDAFVRAKDAYVRDGSLEPMHARVAAITGGDPLPYGLEPNRAVIEELVEHALRQRILRREPDLDALFVSV